MIISFIQTKGGTGKTTLAKCLAYSKKFRNAFNPICLVELDAQGTIESWWEQRKAGGVQDKNISFVNLSQASRKEIEQSLIDLASKNAAMILDVPGESVGRFTTRLAAALSNIVLIPMRSSTNDEQSFIHNIYPVIKGVISEDPRKGKSFFILPAFVHPQTKSKNIKEYFKEIMPSTVGCLDAFLPARSVFENFSRDGMNLYEYAGLVRKNSRQYGQAQKAIGDIEKIANAILKLKR